MISNFRNLLAEFNENQKNPSQVHIDGRHGGGRRGGGLLAGGRRVFLGRRGRSLGARQSHRLAPRLELLFRVHFDAVDVGRNTLLGGSGIFAWGEWSGTFCSCKDFHTPQFSFSPDAEGKREVVYLNLASRTYPRSSTRGRRPPRRPPSRCRVSLAWRRRRRIFP